MSLITETEQLSRLSQLLQAIIDIVPTWVQGQLGFATVGDLIVDQELTEGLADGRIVRVLEYGGFDLQKVSGGVVHYTAASGAQFRVRMDRTSPRFFGAAADGTTDDTTALDLADASDAIEIDLGGLSYHYVGTWEPSKPVLNGSVIDDGATISYELLRAGNVATDAEAAAALTEATEVKLANLKHVSDMISEALSGNSATLQGRLVVVSTASGTSTATAWTMRAINTVEENDIDGAQLANSQLILPPGRYRFSASAQFRTNGAARIRLRDVTNNITIGTSADFGNNRSPGEVNAIMTTEVRFEDEVAVELQYYLAVARSSDGLGYNGAASPARYAVVEAIKIG